MKGRKYTAAIFVLVAVLLVPGTGFSKKARSSHKKTAAKTQTTQKSHKKSQDLAVAGTYTIKAGDSLYSIAKTYNTTFEALQALNKMPKTRLKIGQSIKVPVPQSAASANKSVNATDASPQAGVKKDEDKEQASNLESKTAPTKKSTRTKEKPSKEIIMESYKVRRGDSLLKIAKSFHITPNELQAVNKLKNNRIKAGQTIQIPVEKTYQSKASMPAKLKVVLAASQAAFREEIPEPDPSVKDLPLKDRLVEAGFQMLGIRYRFSGNSEKTGLDCSALVRNLFSKVNIHLPRSSRDQFKEGEKVDRDNLQVGDLVFFSSGGKTPNHVGIYLGNNKFLHAARRAKQVIVSDLNKLWYETRYLGARRIMNLWWEEPEASSETDSQEN
jgi:peptidoglycan DL-endopeptidase LytE